MSRPLKALEDADLVALRSEIREEQLRRRDGWQHCHSCREKFLARTGARFCSGRCRTAAYRKRERGAA